MCTIVRTAIHLRVDSTLKSRRLIFCVCCFYGLIIFLRHNCCKMLKALKLHYVEVSLYQPVCSNNGIGRARCFDSAIKFAALAALSLDAKSSLHQFAAPKARGYALVKATPVTVSCAPGDHRPSFANLGCVNNEPVRGVQQSTSTTRSSSSVSKHRHRGISQEFPGDHEERPHLRRQECGRLHQVVREDPR